MPVKSKYGLELHGISGVKAEYWNLSPAALVEESVRRGEGRLSAHGALVVDTRPYTGRSPKDKFIVQYPTSGEDPIFWGEVNQPLSPENYQKLYAKAIEYLKGKDVFVRDALAGAHPDYVLPIRLVTESPYQSLFAYNMFLRPDPATLADHKPEFTIIAVPGLQADPATDGTRTGTFIVLDLKSNILLIGGTRYAGEIKKSIFTVMNYLLPLRGVMSMHCSANVGKDGDVALFFGLSGTGKTTLSSDPERKLIGDDEHGWGEDGVFNIEGGCYAKAIHLRQELEPLIWADTHRFGAVMENVVIDPETRIADFDDASLTENTRVSYPLFHVPDIVDEGRAGHPRNIFFLTADASGVLPPISRLTPAQAQYYFLSGYTSKVAGTEKELGKEPQATFSTCFGAPFLPLNPNVYAKLLGEQIERHNANVWLVNTGWTGGPYGVGKRMYLPYTRAMIRAALNGDLDSVSFQADPVFGLAVPASCPDVPAEVLSPRATWADPAAYDAAAEKLAARFRENFVQYEPYVSEDVLAAAPRSSAVR